MGRVENPKFGLLHCPQPPMVYIFLTGVLKSSYRIRKMEAHPFSKNFNSFMLTFFIKNLSIRTGSNSTHF